MQRLRTTIKDNKVDPFCIGGSSRYVMKDEMEKREIEALQEALAATEAAHQAEKARADEFENSISWKITEPLRQLSRILRARKSKP